MSLLHVGADSPVHLSLLVCPKPVFWYMGLLPCFPDSWRSHPVPVNSVYFFIPYALRTLTTGTAVGLVSLCTPSLCPGSHQLLPAWDKWHLWAIMTQDEQNKTVLKSPSCLAKLDHSFTVMSKENVSGTPLYSSKFMAFLQRVQDHLINCSLCTADTGEQVSALLCWVGIGKSEAILISPLYLAAAICTWIIGISMEYSQSPLLLCMLNSSFTCAGREKLCINIQPANKQGLH